ncbi:MAG TPA: MYXO-CTERM sorting domain-containing protein [Myxococcota bacterium]|nr:MYXO-CTERM sorting domain-containing protein [Myxococcota bacterium]
MNHSGTLRLAASTILTAAVITLQTMPAKAATGTVVNDVPGWSYRFPTGSNSSSNNMYFAVDSVRINPEVEWLFLGGMYVPTGMEDIAKMGPRAFRSQDGGATVQDILTGSPLVSGGLLGGSMCTMNDIDAVYPGIVANKPSVWVACGDSLGLSSEGARFDHKFDAPKAGDKSDSLDCIHMFDASHGVAGASSGTIYLFELNGDGASVQFTPATIENGPSGEHPAADASIAAMTWLSRNLGWAVAVEGEAITETDYEQNETTKQIYYSTRIFGTKDGGRNWSLLGTISMPSEDPVHQVEMFGKTYPLSFDGGWIPRGIDMVDSDTGFLTLVGWDATKSLSVVVKILKTTDGGATWQDLESKMQVGTMTSMFTQPIFFSEVAGTTFWKDDEGVVRGRVVGASFVAEGSSSGGTPPKYFYLTMMSTGDGGATWSTVPFMGEVQMDMTGEGTVPTTPRPMDAVFVDQYRAFAVADKGTIFTFQHKCARQSECDPGYFCDPDKTGKTYLTCVSCLEIGGVDNAGAVEKCSTWTPPPEDTGTVDRDVWEPDGDALAFADAKSGRDLAAWNEGNGSGCSAGPGVRPPWPILMLPLLVMLMARRRRQD